MYGQPGRPPCDHRSVALGDDVGSTPTSQPLPTPVYPDKEPMSPAAKVAIGVAIAVLLIPIVVMVGYPLMLYISFGGTGHDGTDSTVRAARMKADPTARSEVDLVVGQLSPALGQPEKRALIDTCWDTYGNETLNKSITCGRSFYLYYPISAETPPAAWNLGKPLASNWGPDRNADCTSPTGTTKWCLTGSSWRSVLRLQVNGADAGSDRYPKVQGDMFPAEMEGYRELVFAASKGPCVVVQYTLTYFEG